MSLKKLLLAVTMSGLALAFAIDFKIFFFLVLTILILILPFSLLKRKFLFLLILTPFFLLPQLDRYHVFPILAWNISLPIIILLTFYIFTKVRLDTSYNFLIVIFFFYIIFETFRGWNFGYKNYYVVEETLKYLLYPVGFYFTYSVFDDTENDVDFLRVLLIVFISLGIIISIQILFYYFTITLGDRVITRQANLLMISFISAIAYLFYYARRLVGRIFLLLSMTIFLLSIIIMMQRSLWIGVIVSIILFMVLYHFKLEKKKSKSLIIILVILLIIFGAYSLFQSISLDKSVLEERTEVVEQKENTFSVSVRLLSYYHAFRLFMQSPIIGKGMGHSIITPYLNQREIGAVDNSYLVILWKFGIIGFIIFLILYIKCYSQLIRIINKSKYRFNKLFAIVIISILSGQLINGLACVVMTLYYFNLIWAAFIAITDYLYRKEFILNE